MHFVFQLPLNQEGHCHLRCFLLKLWRFSKENMNGYWLNSRELKMYVIIFIPCNHILVLENQYHQFQIIKMAKVVPVTDIFDEVIYSVMTKFELKIHCKCIWIKNNYEWTLYILKWRRPRFEIILRSKPLFSFTIN